MYHPFRHLLSYFRDGDGMTMSIEPTPGGKAEWYSPAEDHMMLRPGQLQVERRCAVAHGLAHRDLGHSGVCEYPDSVRMSSRFEEAADDVAARRLIRLSDFINVICWTDDKDEAADALWVTRHYLEVRLDYMTQGEQKCVREILIARGFS